MDSNKVPMTVQSQVALKTELDRLVHKERSKVIEAIATARAHGDLSENADYDAAKEQQALLESRIAEINHKLACAQVIDISKIESKTITFGASVILETEDGKKVKYQIIGEEESNAKEGKISITSPLAKSLIGKKAGDSFELQTPKGVKGYEILEFYFKQKE